MSFQSRRKRILVAVLNWGLGHAARTVPIIWALQDQGADVLIGSDGEALHFLKKEIPNGQFISLPSYQPRYSANGWMTPTILGQLPKFLRIRRKEHEVVDELIHTYQIDGIITDCRWGCYSNKIPSVILTHQMFLQVPNWARFITPVLNRLNHKVLGQFNERWVPDYAGEPSLSGRLSNQDHHGLKVEFIGPLSRLGKAKSRENTTAYSILVLLSGPEPQRTILEEKLLTQLQQMDEMTLFIRGLPGDQKGRIKNDSPHIKMVNYLTTEELTEALASVRLVIARSGYSTIMDLIATGKRGLLIPTPGQTEQEYLAHRSMTMGLFYAVEQDNFKLSSDIPKALQYKKEPFNGRPSLLDEFIKGYLKRI